MSIFESYGLSTLFDMSTANLYSSVAGGSGAEAIEERGEETVRRVGRTNAKRSTQGLFPGMDTRRALVRPVDVSVTADNRMSDREAGAMSLMILSRCGLGDEDDSIMVGFIKAMCLCMAVNSSSVLVPGRAKFIVGHSEFDFHKDVMMVLGNDARRYFRAYADITRDYLKDLEKEYQAGPTSEDEVGLARYDSVQAMWELVLSVADKRGLSRVPYLIHDSAEFCTGKTATEKMFLTKCKETIFASGAYQNNMVDNPIVGTARQSRPPGPVASSAGSVMPEGY